MVVMQNFLVQGKDWGNSPSCRKNNVLKLYLFLKENFFKFWVFDFSKRDKVLY